MTLGRNALLNQPRCLKAECYSVPVQSYSTLRTEKWNPSCHVCHKGLGNTPLVAIASFPTRIYHFRRGVGHVCSCVGRVTANGVDAFEATVTPHA